MKYAGLCLSLGLCIKHMLWQMWQSIRKILSTKVFEYTGKGSVPKNVTRVVFRSTVTEVGNDAFQFCEKLKEVVLNEGLHKIGNRAFERCKSLESINFPSTLIEVGGGAFHSCRNLKEVVLNEGLQKVGANAFHSCWLLESIKFPSTLIEVVNNSFEFCISLREVVLNEGLQKVGANAFHGCWLLESITFPSISRRLRTLSQDARTATENKINEIPGVEWRGGEILISLESMAAGENWESTRNGLDMIIGLIAYYFELKEATTIFELALWKTRISEVRASSSDIGERDACRIRVPGPAKDAVLQFFW